MFCKYRDKASGKQVTLSNFKGYYFYYCLNCTKVVKLRT